MGLKIAGLLSIDVTILGFDFDIALLYRESDTDFINPFNSGTAARPPERPFGIERVKTNYL